MHRCFVAVLYITITNWNQSKCPKIQKWLNWCYTYIHYKCVCVYIYIVIVQSLSCVWLFATSWTAAHQASILHHLPEYIELVIPSNHLILCHPLLLPSICPSIRVLSNESALRIQWPKFWSFSISSSNEYSGLISFRMDWLDLPAIQGTLNSLLQHHSSKASILRHSALWSNSHIHTRLLEKP